MDKYKILESSIEIGEITDKDRVQPFSSKFAAWEYIMAMVKEKEEFQVSLTEELVSDVTTMTVISDIAEGSAFKCIKRINREGFKELIFKRNS